MERKNLVSYCQGEILEGYSNSYLTWRYSYADKNLVRKLIQMSKVNSKSLVNSSNIYSQRVSYRF